MDDISSFLETMHSKNLVLKKVASRQQARIEALTQQNDELLAANRRKDAAIKEAEAAIARLESALRQAGRRDSPPAWRENPGSSAGADDRALREKEEAARAGETGAADEASATGPGGGGNASGRGSRRQGAGRTQAGADAGGSGAATTGRAAGMERVRGLVVRLLGLDVGWTGRRVWAVSRPVVQGVVLAVVSRGQLEGRGRGAGAE